eukprot:1158701-Pelagomonas_calceolata.AAC.12
MKTHRPTHMVPARQPPLTWLAAMEHPLAARHPPCLCPACARPLRHNLAWRAAARWVARGRAWMPTWLYLAARPAAAVGLVATAPLAAPLAAWRKEKSSVGKACEEAWVITQLHAKVGFPQGQPQLQLWWLQRRLLPRGRRRAALEKRVRKHGPACCAACRLEEGEEQRWKSVSVRKHGAAWCAACCLEEGEGQHWRSIWGSIVAHMVVACRSYRPGGHLSNVAQLAT